MEKSFIHWTFYCFITLETHSSQKIYQMNHTRSFQCWDKIFNQTSFITLPNYIECTKCIGPLLSQSFKWFKKFWQWPLSRITRALFNEKKSLNSKTFDPLNPTLNSQYFQESQFPKWECTFKVLKRPPLDSQSFSFCLDECCTLLSLAMSQTCTQLISLSSLWFAFILVRAFTCHSHELITWPS